MKCDSVPLARLSLRTRVWSLGLGFGVAAASPAPLSKLEHPPPLASAPRTPRSTPVQCVDNTNASIEVSNVNYELNLDTCFTNELPITYRINRNNTVSRDSPFPRAPPPACSTPPTPGVASENSAHVGAIDLALEPLAW